MTSFEVTINVARLLGENVVVPAWPNPDVELVRLCDEHDRLAGVSFVPLISIRLGNDGGSAPGRRPSHVNRDAIESESIGSVAEDITSTATRR